jgi:DNA-binding transcriptional regulator YhcF (GntR family)
MEERPNYYAIIPANVRYNDNLKMGEKMMYGEITSLTYKTGECWASNNYFARLYKVTPQAISKWIKNLEKYKYITITYEKNGKAIEKRIIKLVSTEVEGGINSSLEGYQQEIKENNTSINNTSNKNIYIRKNFKKPTLEEVREYCEERDNNVDPEQFIDFYESKGWVVGKSPMKDWKSAIRTWERNNRAPRKKSFEETLDEWVKEMEEENGTN